MSFGGIHCSIRKEITSGFARIAKRWIVGERFSTTGSGVDKPEEGGI